MRLPGRLVVPLAIILIALLSWLHLGPSSARESLPALVEHRYGEGRLEDREGLRVLHLSGSPYEMGYQHGVLLRQEIRSAIRWRIYEQLVSNKQVSHLWLLRVARHVNSFLAPSYREEMRGLADGAGIAYSDVLLLNSFNDLTSQALPGQAVRGLVFSLYPPFIPPLTQDEVVRAGDSSPATNSVPSVGSLSLRGSFASFGSATEEGKLLQGLVFASPQLSPQGVLFIVYRPRAANSFLALAWPGAVGVTMGLNEEKISVAQLASPSQDASLEGVPMSFLLREVLEYAGNIPGALKVVASGERTGGHNVVIGDGKPADAQAIECSAHLYTVLEAEDDMVLRTNHYLNPALSETQQLSPGDDYRSSQTCFDRMYEALAAVHGRLNLDRAMDVLTDACASEREELAAGEREILIGAVIASSDLEVWMASIAQPDGRVVSRRLTLEREF